MGIQIQDVFGILMVKTNLICEWFGKQLVQPFWIWGLCTRWIGLWILVHSSELMLVKNGLRCWLRLEIRSRCGGGGFSNCILIVLAAGILLPFEYRTKNVLYLNGLSDD